MKKVVVVFPNLNPQNTNGISQKPFDSGKNEEEFLEVMNTKEGNLIIRVNAQLPNYTPTTLAVFKDWIYWEMIV